MKLTKRQKQIRKEILIREWDGYKAEITFKELIEILLSLNSSIAYQILRKSYEKKTKGGK